MIDSGLKDRVILTTGINNPCGIGAATAKAFVAQGAHVAATYLRQPAEAGTTSTPGETYYRAQSAKTAVEVVDAIRESGGKIEAWECDLADPAVIPYLFDQAERLFGPVDV
jgi:3-oxoacyl-[acyl-carrier protein] reductase